MVLWGCLLSILWGCGSPEKEAIPYSLTRIGSYKTVLEGDDREIKIFNGRTDCLDLIGNLNLNRPEDQKMSVCSFVPHLMKAAARIYQNLKTA